MGIVTIFVVKAEEVRKVRSDPILCKGEYVNMRGLLGEGEQTLILTNHIVKVRSLALLHAVINRQGD